MWGCPFSLDSTEYWSHWRAKFRELAPSCCPPKPCQMSVCKTCLCFVSRNVGRLYSRNLALQSLQDSVDGLADGGGKRIDRLMDGWLNDRRQADMQADSAPQQPQPPSHLPNAIEQEMGKVASALRMEGRKEGRKDERRGSGRRPRPCKESNAMHPHEMRK